MPLVPFLLLFGAFHVLRGAGQPLLEEKIQRFLPEVTITPHGGVTEMRTLPVDVISEDSFHRSIKSLPDGGSKISTLLQDMKEKRPVVIVAFGGSMTCAHCCGNSPHPDCPHAGKDDAWPAHLTNYIRQMFDNSAIEIHNLCCGGCGSNVWIDNLVEWSNDPEGPVRRADLVLVETAQNDFDNVCAQRDYGRPVEGAEAVSASNELLIRMILSLPRKPAVLWVAVRPSGNVDSQLRVAVPYGIPYIDVSGGLFNYDKALYDNSHFHDWYDDVYTSDHCHHLSITGQKLVGVYALHFLDLIFHKFRFSPELNVNLVRTMANDTSAPRFVNQAPLFMASTVSNMYTKGNALTVSLIEVDSMKPYVHHPLIGFHIMEDIKGKVGLVGHAVGDLISLLFNATTVQDHVRSGLLIMEFLKSYVQMGVAQISLWSYESLLGNEGSACDQDTRALLAKETVDMLWTDHSSITTSTEIPFNTSSLHSDHCLEVIVEIVEPLQGMHREHNKVKLFRAILM